MQHEKAFFRGFLDNVSGSGATTVLRVIITPRMQETDTGVFKVSYL